ncbi:hypothetical protein [Foetidibacter luteolus]|uniref:hypothetical protein n=1 Tax=Foetidibacter luteolus TaxID=2608880 RepID=UPI00129B33E9|nr:hypothetical protein [Foetidibacter luteolus]
MTWHEISQLKNKTNGSRVFTLEEVLKHCQGKIAVMIDNKINGFDSTLFTRLVNLLQHYGLAGEAR